MNRKIAQLSLFKGCSLRKRESFWWALRRETKKHQASKEYKSLPSFLKRQAE